MENALPECITNPPANPKIGDREARQEGKKDPEAPK